MVHKLCYTQYIVLLTSLAMAISFFFSFFFCLWMKCKAFISDLARLKDAVNVQISSGTLGPLYPKGDQQGGAE